MCVRMHSFHTYHPSLWTHRIDFYVRVFVRVYTSKSEVKNSCLRRGYVYQSMDTPEFYVHPVRESLA